MRNVAFALEDMKRQWLGVASILIQFTLSMCLLCYGFSMLIDGLKTIEKAESIGKDRIIFTIADTLEESEISNMKQKQIDAMSSMCKYLQNNSGLTMVTLNNSEDFAFDTNDRKAQTIDRDILIHSEGAENLLASQVQVNEAFFSFFDIGSDFYFANKKM